MMPDLGTYALPVLGSYAAALALLAALVLLSVWRARRVARRLAEAEADLKRRKEARHG
jgi:heme exporter protein D